jgi:hypothetical protein
LRPPAPFAPLRGALLALAPLCLAAAAAHAQTTAGAEFRVNTYTPTHQYPAAVASAPDGRFVVTWGSYTQDGSSWGVYVQRYAPDGAAVGVEFRVNTTVTGYQYARDVAMHPDGSFVVVWDAQNGDGSGTAVMGRRYDAAGVARGGEFRVNTFVAGDQYRGRIALAPGGAFTVVWGSVGQDGSGYGIFGQRFDPTGARAGAEFRVNGATAADQYEPNLAAAPDGRFVVAWSGAGADGSGSGIVARRFAANGTPLGGDFAVNTYTTGDQGFPAVALADDGRFTAVWTNFTPVDGSLFSVFARTFDAAGTPQSGEIQVNTYTTGQQSRPVVGADGSGNFFVSWQSGQDGSLNGVYARRFTAAGAPRGGELRVNTFTVGFQDHPLITVDGAGNAVVGWRSALQDGSGFGAFAQRYGGLVPAALVVDAVATATSDGNRVLEPEEVVNVEPAWRNVNGAAQAFTGTASSFTGPESPTYTYRIDDGTAAYGTVAHGATGSCTAATDCYQVDVFPQPGVRPAQDWDAVLVEDVAPGTLGQSKRWVLHIGESFTDVPRAHATYRFVETLLHHAVTGGCAAQSYCPDASTAREQMAVFALAAREPRGYAPPACTTPMFNDVPASSPFCRWIEELARRGVVGGCGGGSYCPTAVVTRQEMAVFALATKEGPGYVPPACGTPVFNDVPASSPFCRWIEELARRGVVSGCGGGNYCPTAPVTRAQMSVFIAVTFGLNLYGP